MKRVFLILVLATAVFSMNSCSSDSNDNSDWATATGTISYKANGVQMTHHSIKFHEEIYLVGTADEYVDVDVFTNDGIDIYEVLFSFKEGDLSQLSNFTLVQGGDVGLAPVDGFTINITSNSNKHLTGTFSGLIPDWPNDVNVTEGTFDIKY